MQGGRRGRSSLFGFDPFGDFGGFGGLGGPQSLLSSVFGGQDPFDDPFFTRPFASPFDSMFESSFFGTRGSPFAGASPAGFIEQQEIQQQEPLQNKRRGPIIQEIDSDDEKAEDEAASKTRDNPRKCSRIDNGPSVEIPDDEPGGERNQHIQRINEFNSSRQPQPQSQCFTFQSSTVTYGGANGAYYTKSMTRRGGSDGVKFEEFKEADSTTGQANHRISREIHNKGHTLARKLSSDGRVDTMQTLHNLNEDELAGFEQAWEGSSGRHLPGWRQRLEGGNAASSSNRRTNQGGWALHSAQQLGDPSSNNLQLASKGGAAAHMQQTMRRPADPVHIQQSRAMPEYRTNMQQTGRRNSNQGTHGRKRA